MNRTNFEQKGILGEFSEIIINEVQNCRERRSKSSHKYHDSKQSGPMFDIQVTNRFKFLRRMLRRKSEQILNYGDQRENKKLKRLEMLLVGHKFILHEHMFLQKKKFQEQQRQRLLLLRGVQKQKTMRKGSVKTPDIVLYHLRMIRHDQTVFPIRENTNEHHHFERSSQKQVSYRKKSNEQSDAMIGRNSSPFRKGSNHHFTVSNNLNHYSHTPSKSSNAFDHPRLQKSHQTQKGFHNQPEQAQKRRGNSFHCRDMTPIRRFQFLEDRESAKQKEQIKQPQNQIQHQINHHNKNKYDQYLEPQQQPIQQQQLQQIQFPPQTQRIDTDNTGEYENLSSGTPQSPSSQQERDSPISKSSSSNIRNEKLFIPLLNLNEGIDSSPSREFQTTKSPSISQTPSRLSHIQMPMPLYNFEEVSPQDEETPSSNRGNIFKNTLAKKSSFSQENKEDFPESSNQSPIQQQKVATPPSFPYPFPLSPPANNNIQQTVTPKKVFRAQVHKNTMNSDCDTSLQHDKVKFLIKKQKSLSSENQIDQYYSIKKPNSQWISAFDEEREIESRPKVTSLHSSRSQTLLLKPIKYQQFSLASIMKESYTIKDDELRKQKTYLKNRIQQAPLTMSEISSSKFMQSFESSDLQKGSNQFLDKMAQTDFGNKIFSNHNTTNQNYLLYSSSDKLSTPMSSEYKSTITLLEKKSPQSKNHFKQFERGKKEEIDKRLEDSITPYLVASSIKHNSIDYQPLKIQYISQNQLRHSENL